MDKTKKYFLRNIVPPAGVMLICILGAFFVYKGYYTEPYHAKSFANIQPAAGYEIFNKNNRIPVWRGQQQFWQ